MKMAGNDSAGKRVLMGAALVALLSISSTAWAQSEGDAKDDEIPSGPLKEKLEDYWSVDRDLDVVRKRKFTRDGKIAVEVFGGLMPSEPFFQYFPLGARGGYFLSDSFGIEVSGQYMLRSNTELTDYVEGPEGRGESFDPETDTGDIFQWRANAVVTWHPLYGKWSLLQRKGSHIDFNVVGGFGVVGLNRPDELRTSSSSAVVPEFVTGLGINFYLSELVALRLQNRIYVYPGAELNTSDELSDRGFFSRLEVPAEFLLGFSFLL